MGKLCSPGYGEKKRTAPILLATHTPIPTVAPYVGDRTIGEEKRSKLYVVITKGVAVRNVGAKKASRSPLTRSYISERTTNAHGVRISDLDSFASSSE